MKSFLKNIVLFATPLFILLFILEVILPPTMFTFRIWEAIKFKNDLLVGPFYPNSNYSMIEVGDLSHHTKFAIEKQIKWRTDKLGFRNNHYISNPQILIIGDSNITGSSLSQDETLVSVLNQCGSLSAYSLAPANINIFIALKNEGVMKTPKILILSRMERGIPSLPPYNTHSKVENTYIRLNTSLQFFTVPFDKLLRANSISYLKSRIAGTVGAGIQSKTDDKMLFLQGNKAIINPTDNKLNQISEKIGSYKNYCDSIGCKFIFLPIPNKETIFWEMLELQKQPTFLNQLNRKLRIKGLTTIDTVKLFNRLKRNELLPYHYDDSHWNAYGVNTVAREIVRLSTSNWKDVGVCSQTKY